MIFSKPSDTLDDKHIAALASLAELFPDAELSDLRSALSRSKWNVETAANLLFAPNKGKAKRSIQDFFTAKVAEAGSEQTAQPAAEKPSPRKSFFAPRVATSSTVESKPEPELTLVTADVSDEKNALSALSWKEGAAPKKARNTFHNVVLNTPELVALHVPSCSFHADFLPPDLADAILRYMMSESKTWSVPKYVIFEKETESAHTSATYITNRQEIPKEEGIVFGGRYLSDVRDCTPDMVRAKSLIEAKVNELMTKREKHRLEFQGPWSCNTVLCNSYIGPDSGVGPHTDRMTHLGPRPTIASLTLGAGRMFRLRPTDPNDNPDPTFNPEASSTYPSYLIPLPHNSLLIMHPPTQEYYKHDIPKITSNLPPIRRHPISGLERINMTFRHYREDFAANKTPNCFCGNKMDLQVAFNKDREKYFYTCSGAGGKGKKVGERCTFFRWLEAAKKD